MKIRLAKQHPVLRRSSGQGFSSLQLATVAVSVCMAVVGLSFPDMTRAMMAVPGLTITVRVYDYAQTSPTVLSQAERQAGRIFSEAGLNVVWLDCATGPAVPDSKDPCQQAMADEDVRVRILTAPVQNFLQDAVFGFAVAPALATVYYESVLALAKYDDRAFEAPVILGCAIAHEIGHLLLGPNAHSFSGIMRARWERGNVQQQLMGAVLFTPKQARLIQAEINRRTAPRSPEKRTAHISALQPRSHRIGERLRSSPMTPNKSVLNSGKEPGWSILLTRPN